MEGDSKMNKKFCLLLVCIGLLILLVSCSNNEVQKEVEDERNKSMFVELEWTSDWSVVYHKETKVMYAVSQGTYNRGVFTLLVNPDGSPMIYGTK